MKASEPIGNRFPEPIRPDLGNQLGTGSGNRSEPGRGTGSGLAYGSRREPGSREPVLGSSMRSERESDERDRFPTLLEPSAVDLGNRFREPVAREPVPSIREPVAPRPTLPRVSLGQMRIAGVEVLLREMPREASIEVLVQLRGVVDSRGSGQVTEVRLSDTMPLRAWASLGEQSRRSFIRRVVMHALTHEVDEWLEIDGERGPDPHEGDVR